MAKAKIRKMNLPDAPSPTKAVRYKDPREIERAKRIQEHHGINLNQSRSRQLCFWDSARVARLRRMWEEGYPVKYIARECGADLVVCQNRITYEINCGRLEPRQTRISPEEKERIYRLYDAGVKIPQIAKDMKRSAYRIQKVLKERKNNET